MEKSSLIRRYSKNGKSLRLKLSAPRLKRRGQNLREWSKRQRQNANATPSLPDAAEGESSANMKKEELAALNSPQPGTSTSVDEEPQPKVAKISKPQLEKVPAPSLIVDGPRQRKATKPFNPSVPTTFGDYVFEGKRLVNMGYFLKSLQTLNDHEGRECNFSDMRVCAETSNEWNVGIVFTCKLCPITKVIWMEDPSAREAPSSPIIFKRKASTKSNLRPTATTIKARKPARTPKRVRQPSKSKQKINTLVPNDTTAGNILQPQVTMQFGQLSNYPHSLLIRPNTTIQYGPSQNPLSVQLRGVQSVASHQVPTITQSQVIDQSQTLAINQSLVPLTDFPPVASIKQEIILPDDGTIPSFINSSEPTRVEMSFCVDQDENTVESRSVPPATCTGVDVTKDITLTPGFALAQTSLPSSSGQLSSSAMETITTLGIAPTDALQVDLNLVKKEIDDETPPCQ